MPQTYIRLQQVRKADVFDDTLSAAAVAALEGSATTSEDFLGGILSQFKRIIGGTDWFSSVEASASDTRSLKSLTDNTYFKPFLRQRAVLADISVPMGQNYVVLSAASLQTPPEPAAVTSTGLGAVISILPGDVGTHSLVEVPGLNNINPKNLCPLRESSSFEALQTSSGRKIYALLQAEAGVVDGDVFNDSNHQVQLSFVTQNGAGEDIIACPIADIEGKNLNFSYVTRESFFALNEQDIVLGMFQDPQAPSPVASLQAGYVIGNEISISVGDGPLTADLFENLTSFLVQRNGASFATFTRNDGTGDFIQFDADAFDINLTSDADFNTGLKADTDGTPINIGVTAGQIDATALTVRSTTGNLANRAAAELTFQTVRQTTPIPLDDAVAGSISALPGGPFSSIAAAIRSALTAVDVDVHVQVLASDYAQDVNVPGATEAWTPALDLSTRSIDMTSGAIVNLDTILFLNGRLLVGGNGTVNNDVYLGTTPANGDLRYHFSKGVRAGDWLVALSWRPG